MACKYVWFDVILMWCEFLKYHNTIQTIKRISTTNRIKKKVSTVVDGGNSGSNDNDDDNETCVTENVKRILILWM